MLDQTVICKMRAWAMTPEYQPMMSTKNPHTKAPAVRPAEKATWHVG